MEQSNNTTISKKHLYIFNAVVIWSIITSIFAWLPLIRIIGRPNEYYWGVMSFHGEGANGPFWIFILASIFVICMLYIAFRSPKRGFAHITVLIWQLVISLVILGTTFSESTEASIQGQGLHWKISSWLIALPSLSFLILTFYWIYLDYTQKPHFTIKPWSAKNSMLLGISIALLIIAIILFRLGTNYNWVTSAAIIVTILQWLFMVESFKPKGI